VSAAGAVADMAAIVFTDLVGFTAYTDAHGDRAAVDVLVACSVLASVSAARDRDEFPLAVRMGMHVGDVIGRGDDFVGQTVNIASRVADLAGPGELLVTEQVVRSLDENERTAVFQPVGPTRVKGVGAPIWLHRLAT